MQVLKSVRKFGQYLVSAVHVPEHLAAIMRCSLASCIGMLLLADPSYAASPWEDAVNILRDAFTGSIARGLSLVAIVLGGIMFAFGEGDSKRSIAGIVFGVGMAIGAVNFLNWLFPG